MLRAAVVGLGRISFCHVDAILSLSPTVELTAVCDNNPEVLANFLAKHPNVHGYLDYEEMLAKEKLDAVHLCLPHYLHVPYALLAFEHGINVLSEKPMAISYEDAMRAVKVAKEKKLLYGVIFQIRYDTAPQGVKARIEAGKFGKIISASSVLTWNRSPDYYRSSSWKGTWEKEGGGVVIDQAIHSMDLINWMIGDTPIRVKASFANLGHPEMKVEDTAVGYVDYASGVRYCFYATNNFFSDAPVTLEIHGTKGDVRFGYDDAYISYHDGTKEEIHPDSKDTFKADGRPTYWGHKHDSEIRDFYDCLLHHKPFFLSGEEALKTQKMISWIYQEGRKTL